MKFLVLSILTLGLSSCAALQKAETAEQTTPTQERNVAGKPTVITIRIGRDITGFNNGTDKATTTVVYAQYETEYKNRKFSGYIEMKTPPKTNGTLKVGRVFYATMGDCHIFDRVAKAKNYCNTNTLHLHDSMADLQSKIEPVGVISTWVSGNPTARYGENVEEYADIIKGIFDINTDNFKSSLQYGGTPTQSNDL